MSENSTFGLTPAGKLFVAAAVVVLVLFAVRHYQQPKSAPPKETPLVFQPIDDQFWLHLNRRRSDLYRAQLNAAPPALMIRESHYAFTPANGMGMHYGWLDHRLADLHVGFSELVGYAYGKDYTHTEFPEKWTHGQWTNNYDVICTLTNQPRETFQAAAKQYLRQQYGLSWHLETKNTAVLVLRATDPQLLQTKVTTDFAQSKSIPEFANELENYFSQPVIDETGATQRYDKTVELVPARWVNGRTTDLTTNNQFLAGFGLELVPAKRSQEWLVLDQ
jgi:uncharacterized protein (TIGR03435 family)